MGTFLMGETEVDVPDSVVLENLYIDTVFGRDLFDTIIEHYGKAGWNAYARRLRRHNIWAMYSTPEPTEEDDSCMPVCVQINLRGEPFWSVDLSGLDLLVPEMDRCNFRSANLSGCLLGSVAFGEFHNANLLGADFTTAHITGADFSGSNLIDVCFDGASYYRERPPLNLPETLFARCTPYPEHWALNEHVEKDAYRFPLCAESVQLRSFWGAIE